MYLPIVAYIVIALLVSWVGRRSRLGPAKIFLMAILLTPILPLVYLLVVPDEPRT